MIQKIIRNGGHQLGSCLSTGHNNSMMVISMGSCKKDITPLLKNWSYVFLSCIGSGHLQSSYWSSQAAISSTLSGFLLSNEANMRCDSHEILVHSVMYVTVKIWPPWNATAISRFCSGMNHTARMSFMLSHFHWKQMIQIKLSLFHWKQIIYIMLISRGCYNIGFPSP